MEQATQDCRYIWLWRIRATSYASIAAKHLNSAHAAGTVKLQTSNRALIKDTI